ncbi:hypothetical protein [Streptomyces sp. NPDC001536]|uniref:hypothetical protein n=1 Tax=Streptomyces sp. NPDC001536 TaxID=3364583 RepID=UPI0036798519
MSRSVTPGTVGSVAGCQARRLRRAGSSKGSVTKVAAAGTAANGSKTRPAPVS